MDSLSRYLDGVYLTWLQSSVTCCTSARHRRAPLRDTSRPMSMRIEFHEPRLIPPPLYEPQEQELERPTTRGREWVSRSRSFASRASSRGSFSVRRKLNAYNGPRRPRIGAPSDFRRVDDAFDSHVQNVIPNPLQSSPPRRTEVFRPLELSIYLPQNQMSPLMSHFASDDDMFPFNGAMDLAFPQPAITHSRSDSSLSFQIPRKPVRSSSGTLEWNGYQSRPASLSANDLLARLEKEMPRAPQPARIRANTEPPVYERIKSALHEKFELEQKLKDIDEVIEERKSVYFGSSRPTSRASHLSRASRPRTGYTESQEPLPTPLTQNPNPSFARRISLPLADQRPRTSPSNTRIPSRLQLSTEASGSPKPSLPPRSPLRDRAIIHLPPPLPLVLQAPHPPLRKKKSFSRISTWLFPDQSQDPESHTRSISTDSVTNTPKPVTSRDGFYQCVELKEHTAAETARRQSMTSVSTVSTMSTDVDYAPTIPTTSFSTPHSSPERNPTTWGEKREIEPTIRSFHTVSPQMSVDLERVRTLGEKEMPVAVSVDEKWKMQIPEQGYVPRRTSVGVAF